MKTMLTKVACVHLHMYYVSMHVYVLACVVEKRTKTTTRHNPVVIPIDLLVLKVFPKKLDLKIQYFWIYDI